VAVETIDEARILAGGLGSRLRSVIGDRPKPLAEIGGRPFVERLLEQLCRHGVRKAVMCIGYRADQVRAAMGDRFGPLELAYSVEGAPLGTAGALRRGATLLSGDDVLAMNGDSFCDADLGQLVAAHRGLGGVATVAALHRKDRRAAGVIECDANGRVVRFAARPTDDAPGLINSGLYAFRREALLKIAADRFVSLEEEVLPQLATLGTLYCWRVDADFIDIGTPATYRAAQTFFQEQ